MREFLHQRDMKWRNPYFNMTQHGQMWQNTRLQRIVNAASTLYRRQ